jgi:hypothetical protein
MSSPALVFFLEGKVNSQHFEIDKFGGSWPRDCKRSFPPPINVRGSFTRKICLFTSGGRVGLPDVGKKAKFTFFLIKLFCCDSCTARNINIFCPD